jgi:hypothetical protein
MALKDELVKKMVSSLNKENIPGSELAKTVNDVTSSVKKFETDESTGSGSAGAFVAPLGSKKETNEKWSEKYKKSIDCNNPKGFSQKAHCQGRKKKLKENLTEAERTSMAKLRDIAKKYVCKDSKDCTAKDKIEKVYQDLKKQFQIGIKVEKEHKSADPKLIALDHLSEDPKYYTKLKKVEANEATGSSSSGSYETPAFGAKSMSPKDWRGASKTQIPGGQFVKVKEKCKTFPYCNQGDINALDLSENKFTKKIIEKLSEEYFIDVKTLSNIILKEINKTK